MKATALCLRLSLICVVGLIAAPGSAPGAEPTPSGVPGNWHLIFNEEFSGAGLNSSLWTAGWQHGGISGPVSGQCLNSSFVSQPGNGYLYLELKHQSNSCEWRGERASVGNTGALVESNPGDGVAGHTGFTYSYGYVEWHVYIPPVAPEGWGCPKGGCLPDWPALWSLPESHENEIDTMEGLGHLGEACYHFHPPWGSAGPGGCSGSRTGWHTYGVDWEPGVVTYYYDGERVGQIASGSITPTPNYLVMDVVPGTDGQPLIVPDTMAVDYVRVWSHPIASTSSTWAAVSPKSNNINAFYKNTSGKLDDEFELSGSWYNSAFAGEVTGTAAAIENRAGTNINAFYQTPGGQLDDEFWLAGDNWENSVLARNAAGSPAAIENDASTNINAFYKNASGQLDDEFWIAGGPWENSVFTSNDAGDPAAIENAEGTNINAFYKNTSGQLQDEFWIAGGPWESKVMANGMEGTPAAVENAEGTNINCFYRNSSGQLDDEFWFASTGWQNMVLANGMRGNPTVIEDRKSSGINVYYENTAGQLVDEYGSSSGWSEQVLTNGVDGQPAAVENYEGSNVNVFYRNTNSELADEFWLSGIGWANTTLVSGVAP